MITINQGFTETSATIIAVGSSDAAYSIGRIAARHSSEMLPKGFFAIGSLSASGVYTHVGGPMAGIVPDLEWLERVRIALNSTASLKDLGECAAHVWTYADFQSVIEAFAEGTPGRQMASTVFQWYCDDIDNLARAAFSPEAMRFIMHHLLDGDTADVAMSKLMLKLGKSQRTLIPSNDLQHRLENLQKRIHPGS